MIKTPDWKASLLLTFVIHMNLSTNTWILQFPFFVFFLVKICKYSEFVPLKARLALVTM